MSGDGPVLDLDTPEADAPRERQPLATRGVPLWVVAVVAVVVALVAVPITRAVDDDRLRREQSGAVRLLVSVPPDTELAGGGDYLSSSFRSALSVVNAGPLPVDVVGVSSATDGIRVDPVGPDPGVTVPAGEDRQVFVGVRVVCRAWRHRPSVDLVITVTTADGGRRAQHHALARSPWTDVLQSGCPPGF